MKTTLNEIRSFDPCPDRLRHGLQHADPRPANDEPFPITRVLDVNGLSDTLWLLSEMGEQQLLARFVSDCAERAVERYWEPEYPDDRRPQRAIDAARRWVASPTEENRAKADAAAEAVEDAAYYVTRAAAAHAADPAARAAVAAAKAARTVSAASASAAAAAYAKAAAEGADAEGADAEDAKERTWQIAHLRKMLDRAGALRAGTTDRGENDH